VIGSGFPPNRFLEDAGRPEVPFGSFPAVSADQRRGSSTSISGPRPANLGGLFRAEVKT